MRTKLRLNGRRLQHWAAGFLAFGLLLRPAAASPAPIITVQPVSQNAPLLGIVTFSVTASSQTTMTYQWFKNGGTIGGATSSSYTILTVLGSDSGTYAVKVTNAGGSVMSSNATLNINLPPTITTQPQRQAVAQGQNVSFYVAATGSAPLSCQWYFNGLAISGATNASLYLASVQPAQAGDYSVVVANNVGWVSSAVAGLTVYVPPLIVSAPVGQIAIQGQSPSFSVAATGSAPFSYQWTFNGSAIPGATASSLTLADVLPNQAGSYSVLVSNVAGSVKSPPATLVVIAPPNITTQPQAQSVAVGQPAYFSVAASGSAPLSYQWNFNGAPLAGATDSVLTLTNVELAQAGSFNVVVTNSAGSVTSAVATLTVTNAPVILSLSGSGMSANGFSFQFPVPIGHTYIIFVTAEFKAWTPILTNIATTANVVVTDADAAYHHKRFYRVAVQ